MFADCAVQVHYGDAVEPPGRLGWHSDAPNSLIHMAIALRGRRALHSRLKHTAEGRREHVVEWQEPGCVYVTSPTCFEHAVEYPECSYTNRVVAVQTRLLVNEEELYTGFASENQERDWCDLMDALGPAIASISTEMPSLEAVQEMERMLAAVVDDSPPGGVSESPSESGRPSFALGVRSGTSERPTPAAPGRAAL